MMPKSEHSKSAFYKIMTRHEITFYSLMEELEIAPNVSLALAKEIKMDRKDVVSRQNSLY